MNPSGLIHVSDQCHRARVFPLPKAEDAQLRSRLSPRLDESWVRRWREEEEPWLKLRQTVGALSTQPNIARILPHQLGDRRSD